MKTIRYFLLSIAVALIGFSMYNFIDENIITGIVIAFWAGYAFYLSKILKEAIE
ncbi:MAG: hypothetical protein K9I68_00320 [Bacteroidales bacterium]|nr:hypothetical protein [Bacteroidales bacterium]MCF8336423.1 hypothetical protein [Bacteroidales bacterium]